MFNTKLTPLNEKPQKLIIRHEGAERTIPTPKVMVLKSATKLRLESLVDQRELFLTHPLTKSYFECLSTGHKHRICHLVEMALLQLLWEYIRLLINSFLDTINRGLNVNKVEYNIVQCHCICNERIVEVCFYFTFIRRCAFCLNTRAHAACPLQCKN